MRKADELGERCLVVINEAPSTGPVGTRLTGTWGARQGRKGRESGCGGVFKGPCRGMADGEGSVGRRQGGRKRMFWAGKTKRRGKSRCWSWTRRTWASSDLGKQGCGGTSDSTAGACVRGAVGGREGTPGARGGPLVSGAGHGPRVEYTRTVVLPY